MTSAAAAMPAPASASAARARPPVRRRLGRVCNLGRLPETAVPLPHNV